MPANDLKELITWLKANPDKASQGTGGIGATSHIAGVFFQQLSGTRFTLVPYRGAGPAMQDLLSEQIDLMIDPASRRVQVDGAEIQLTQREFDVLLFLARHPGQVFSRNQLMDAIWQYSFYTDTSTVTVHVRRLRAKIEADPAQPRHIETVWGVGYRFTP